MLYVAGMTKKWVDLLSLCKEGQSSGLNLTRNYDPSSEGLPLKNTGRNEAAPLSRSGS